MADVGLLESVGKQVLKDEFKGLLYLLFFTEDCASCTVTEERLHLIMQEENFRHENIFIVPKDYFTWLGLIKKFKVRGYPCLIKTIDSKLVEKYSNQNIITVFKTGLV